MSRDALPDPPQMRNGGSPPAHLSSSYLSDPSSWLHIKCSQPPPRAPGWLFDYYESYNPPPLDTFGQPICEDWLQRATREDQRAARLLPPAPHGGPILTGAHARTDRAYRAWKRAIDELWADEHHRLGLVEEQATRARQEEAAASQERAARARQEEAAVRASREGAAARVRARREEAADARRKTAAAQLIFLWLRRRRLHARLAQQRMQVAAAQAQAKALADEAKAQHRQAEAAIGEQRRQAAAAQEKHAADERCAAESVALALAEERCRHEALLAAEADVQRRHEAVLAAEADVQRRHEKVLAAEADVQRRHKEMLAAVAADVQRRHESAAGDTESDAAIERIRTEFALCAAPLDAILAEIACEDAAIMKTLSPGRPTSYVDAVLSNMGGGTQSSLPLAGSPALPSPDVASRLQIGGSHPPLSTTGGASHAAFQHVGGSNFT